MFPNMLLDRRIVRWTANYKLMDSEQQDYTGSLDKLTTLEEIKHLLTKTWLADNVSGAVHEVEPFLTFSNDVQRVEVTQVGYVGEDVGQD